MKQNQTINKFSSINEIITQVNDHDRKEIDVVCECIWDNQVFDVFINFENITFHEKVSFNGTKFNGGVSFKKVVFKQEANFIRAHFNKKVSFKKANFKNGCRFNEAVFYNTNDKDIEKELRTYRRYGTFRSTEFNRIAEFKEAKFHENIFFGLSTFERANFDEATFNKTVSFSRVIFKGQASYNKTKILGKILLENSIFFNYPAQFIDTKFTIISLKGVFFDKPAKFQNLDINKDFRTKNKKLDYNTLKNEMILTNNKIEARKILTYEMNAYKKSLNIKSDFIDLVILFFNKHSNSYGTNWAKGALFTLVVSTIFFILYWLNTEQPFSLLKEQIFIKYYVQFLFIGHDFDFMKANTPNGLAYIIDMIGRIFISYGYYQTIAAFRKFGTNSN